MHHGSMVHMHHNPLAKEVAYAPGSIHRVPNKPKTPNRVLRVDEELWRDYGEVCVSEGVSKSDDLRAHMQRKVRSYKRRQQREATDE